LKWTVWICSGIIATLLWLIVMAPARLLIEPAARAGILLGTLEGSIWSGGAQQLIFKQQALQYSMTDLRWFITPVDLLQGALCFDVAADPGTEARSSGFLAGKICLHANGTSTVSALSIELSAATLIRSESIRIQGTILLEVDNLSLRGDRTLETFTAQGRWIEAGAAIDADFQRLFLNLGDLAITGHHLSPSQIEFVLTSSDVESNSAKKSDMMFNFRSQIGIDGTWQVSGVIKPDADMNSATRELLALLTEPDQAGNYNIYWQNP
jgi:hypothetical protein